MKRLDLFAAFEKFVKFILVTTTQMGAFQMSNEIIFSQSILIMSSNSCNFRLFMNLAFVCFVFMNLLRQLFVFIICLMTIVVPLQRLVCMTYVGTCMYNMCYIASCSFYIPTYSTSLTENVLDFCANLGFNLQNAPVWLLQCYGTIQNRYQAAIIYQ